MVLGGRAFVNMHTFVILIALGGPLASAAAPLPQAAKKTVWDGVYTEAQARRGEQVFKGECSYCHRDDLSGGFFDNGTGRVPALTGPRAFDSSFVDRWNDMTVGDMVATIAATMPQEKPASLSIQAYVDVASFLLEKNQIPSGKAELPTDVNLLLKVLITPKSGN